MKAPNEHLKELRQTVGISPQEAAHRLDITTNEYACWEQGIRPMPERLVTLLKKPDTNWLHIEAEAYELTKA